MDRNVKKALFVLAGAVFVAFLYFYFSLERTFEILGGSDAVLQKQEEPAEIEPGSDDGKTTLVAVGDIMLSRGVEQKMIAKGDWKYPFLGTAEMTRKADIAFGNLETTVLPGKAIPSGSFTFRTDPKALAGLEYGGFDVLSLANNHMMNFGLNGLRATIDNLDDAGISHAGAGLSDEEIAEPVIMEADGMSFGFLAYSYAKEQSFHDGGKTYGVAYAKTDDMKRQVAALRQRADVVVVSMHMGNEYEIYPSSAQKGFARAAVDAGADLVIGHHPHVVQTFEKYKEGYIIYSLGNFVFDQMWSEETRLGVVATVTFEGKKIESVEFTPVKIFDYAQPQFFEGAQAEMISERLEATDDR